VTAAFHTSGASEFPNDNPALHRGARWVCLLPRGPARALLRPSAGADVRSLEGPEEPPHAVPQPAAVAPERRFEGPLELDLGRIVLPHRVENIPPPPDFIFRPFVAARAKLGPPSALPIDPRPCRVVDEREAGRRVDRGSCVDVAPCIHVGVAVSEPSRRQPRRRGALAARLVLAAAFAAPPLELEAASA
jgi:hypothetical protein